MIAEYLKDPPLLHDYFVATDTVYVGPDREEIDLLIRIGRLLLVGEAKCSFSPPSRWILIDFASD